MDIKKLVGLVQISLNLSQQPHPPNKHQQQTSSGPTTIQYVSKQKLLKSIASDHQGVWPTGLRVACADCEGSE